jgi:hypothetical protein
MKPKWHRLKWIFLALLASALPLGCGGDGGESGLDYRGTWQGKTSHGGDVIFTVGNEAVDSLRIVDDQAEMKTTQPVAIEGNSFSVMNSEGATAPNSPGVSVQGTFDSETQASGSYSITQASQTWAGTFTASRQ